MAFGIKARPLKNVPFDISIESRRDATNGKSRGVGIFIAGGLPPAKLPQNFTLESYFQTGAVLQDQTRVFFDGALTATHPVAVVKDLQLSAGAGIWGNGQDEVRRLDVGPRLELRFPVGETTQSIALDWRQRIAGSALPGSGLAITLAVQY